VHGALVTAVSNAAFGQAVGMLRRHRTMALVGLPPGTFPTPIFDVVLKGLTIRRWIVGTRNDLAEALTFASTYRVVPRYEWPELDAINETFRSLADGTITGPIVLDLEGGKV